MLNRHPKSFDLADVPSAASVGRLIANLRADHLRRSVSPENHAHRSRVIRQQTALLKLRLDLPSDGEPTS